MTRFACDIFADTTVWGNSIDYFKERFTESKLSLHGVYRLDAVTVLFYPRFGSFLIITFHFFTVFQVHSFTVTFINEYFFFLFHFFYQIFIIIIDERL